VLVITYHRPPRGCLFRTVAEGEAADNSKTPMDGIVNEYFLFHSVKTQLRWPKLTYYVKPTAMQPKSCYRIET
jgi:hypothetical protein